MAKTHFDHGKLPEMFAHWAFCPGWWAHPDGTHGNPTLLASRTIEPVEGSGYRAKFKCAECGLEFTVSDAQMRRHVDFVTSPQKARG